MPPIGGSGLQATPSRAWELANRQHGVIARQQLLGLGFSRHAIAQRIARGRWHRVERGVYAVGRAELTNFGRGMAAVLSCGPSAVLSHESAAALWMLYPMTDPVQVTVPAHVALRRARITVHRRVTLKPSDTTCFRDIPVTTPICTLIDLSVRFEQGKIEHLINEADKRNLIDPESLRSALESHSTARPGVARLRKILDEPTFRLTDSELERLFLPIAREAGLPTPQTGQWVNGFKVDFYWPELKLVVETDGLRYHRTAAQQAKDLLRDQTHIASGLTPLRFSYAQVRYEPASVRTALEAFVGLQEDGLRG